MTNASANVSVLRPLPEPVPQITFALAIPTTAAWVPGRRESLERLKIALGLPPGLVDGHADGGLVEYRELRERASNDEWSGSMFAWLSESRAEWCVQLQDDALVAPNFWPALRALVAALPEDADLVGLQVPHPAARLAAREDVRLVTTSDGLVGVGWAVRRSALVNFLTWRAHSLRAGWRTPVPPRGAPSLTEDTMLGLWALTTGRQVWHPVPTIVDHDVSLESTYGNDEAAGRRSVVTWRDAARYDGAWLLEDLELPAFWRGKVRRVDGDFAHSAAPEPPRHLGRFYSATPALARRWVVGFDEAELLRAKQDDGAHELRRLHYARGARSDYQSRARVLVCTPTRGGVHPTYTSSMLATVRLFEADVTHGFELLDCWQWHEDVVRVRSRFLRAALETDCTHVHFRDADVSAPSAVLVGMLRSGHDVVITPYPRRDKIPAEYALGMLPGGDGKLDVHGCTPIAWGPLGCALISRACIERMTTHYRQLDQDRVDLDALKGCAYTDTRGLLLIAEAIAELQAWRAGDMGLTYVDQHQGEDHETVGLFQLLNLPSEVSGRPRLRSEDQSFCFRARRCGYQVQLYLGPGSPADHAGEHVFKGDLAFFGVQRLDAIPGAAT